MGLVSEGDTTCNGEFCRPMPRPGLLEARLVVAASGAGLSLLWCPGEGYRVQDIEAVPRAKSHQPCRGVSGPTGAQGR